MRTMYLPEEYLNWKKSDNDKLKYVYDFHLYNLDDFSSFINIPFIVNYQVIIGYDKILHYNTLYKDNPIELNYPLISRYYNNNTVLSYYLSW